MIVYRITQGIYHQDITGTGARLHGGRWNEKGMPVLYTSESRALSTLELLVHTDYDLLPPKLKLLWIEIPRKWEDIFEIKQNQLPTNWEKSPPPPTLKKIGQQRLIKEDRLAIKVPSVIIPDEFNIVINPAHKDFNQVRIKKIQSYELDGRFFRG